ncbi:MAG: hypothetical protein J5725_08190 [Bacteroidales bacterium]|nr:hypothetical protein [Bacteroidales bacterium]
MNETIMYRVVDNKSLEVLFIGHTEDECVAWIIKHDVKGVFVEKYKPRKGR